MRVISSCIGCITMILLLSGVAAASGIATVHGVAYEWSTFEPLDNAIIEVNSTPAQSMVAKYGVYSFELSNGTYNITASYYQDDLLTYYAEDTITVSDEGSYVLDLLLLPSYSGSGQDTVVSPTSNSENASSSTVTNGSSLLFGSVFVVIVLLIFLAYQMKQRPQRSLRSKAVKKEEPLHVAPVITEHTAEEVIEQTWDVAAEEDREEFKNDAPACEPLNGSSEEPEPEQLNASVIPSDGPVPADLQEILDILRSQGGRMTQKDMRKRLKYSEGKVSLMLLDLEKRGKIQKFKKGRGNVLFLVGSDE